MSNIRIRVLVIALCLLSAGPAFADSDAYFCTWRGYLAFETRLGTGKHELHVVRFGAGGITAAPPIALDEFQVHGMICRAGQIEIQGWERTYTIDLAAAGKAVVTSRAAAFNASQSKPPENLGHLGKPQVIDLDADGGNRFQLVIARASKPVKGGIEHHTTTRIVQRSANRLGSGIAVSRQLFEGVFLETID
ncbi:MAG TPA: hypothetical protein VJ691_06295 [Vicinamibacterales bacterium]|nr:hypothetical protein [Vicinamibacterales bacterium]